MDLYLSQLAPITKALLWVTTSAVLGLKKFPQETGQIKKENDDVVAMLRAKGPCRAAPRLVHPTCPTTRGRARNLPNAPPRG